MSLIFWILRHALSYLLCVKCSLGEGVVRLVKCSSHAGIKSPTYKWLLTRSSFVLELRVCRCFLMMEKKSFLSFSLAVWLVEMLLSLSTVVWRRWACRSFFFVSFLASKRASVTSSFTWPSLAFFQSASAFLLYCRRAFMVEFHGLFLGLRLVKGTASLVASAILLIRWLTARRGHVGLVSVSRNSDSRCSYNSSLHLLQIGIGICFLASCFILLGRTFCCNWSLRRSGECGEELAGSSISDDHIVFGSFYHIF